MLTEAKKTLLLIFVKSLLLIFLLLVEYQLEGNGLYAPRFLAMPMTR